MKEAFSCSLTGTHWWKPFLGLFILTMVIMIPLHTVSNSLYEIQDPGVLLSSVLFILVLSVIITLVQAIFYIILSRIAFPTIKFREKHFSFNGSIGEYVSLNLVCSLLVLITFGFYLPWYYSRIMQYYVSHITYDGEPARFNGSPKKLMKYYILGLILPLFIWSIAYGTIIVTAITYQINNYTEIAESLFIVLVILNLLLLVILVPFIYYLYKWLVNFSWKQMRFYWKTEFWSSFFFIIGQVLLMIITLGIYLPAGILSLWKYFIDRTVVDQDGQPAGHFVFTREAGGFSFLWGQILLSLVTLGIYMPWAYANIIRYLLSHVALEETPAELPQNY